MRLESPVIETEALFFLKERSGLETVAKIAAGLQIWLEEAKVGIISATQQEIKQLQLELAEMKVWLEEMKNSQNAPWN